MKELSPQAQAVLTALNTAPAHTRLMAAAVLRAAAEQVVPYVHSPGGCREGERQCVRRELFAIAAELEAGG